MFILFFILLSLVFPAPIQAVAIVSIGPDILLSHEVLTPDCEYLDTFQREVTTKELVVVPSEDDLRLLNYEWWDVVWRRIPELGIHGHPNECYYNLDGSDNPNPPDYCSAELHNPHLMTSSESNPGGSYWVTNVEWEKFTEYSNSCGGHECHPHAVPEPSTVTLGILGLLFLIGRGWKKRGERVVSPVSAGTRRVQWGWFFPKARVSRGWPRLQLRASRLTLFLGRFGFVYFDWDPEFVCPECLHSRSTLGSSQSNSDSAPAS